VAKKNNNDVIIIETITQFSNRDRIISSIYQKTSPTDSLKWTKSEMKSNYSEISATVMVLIGRDA
jgi:hypothetical protein